MRLIGAAACALFLAFAAVHIGGPKNFAWVLVYGFAAMLGLVTMLGVNVLMPAVAAAAAYAIGSTRVLLFTSAETRDVIGLLLCLAWAVCTALHSHRKYGTEKKNASHGSKNRVEA